MHEEPNHVDLSAVASWTGSTDVSPTHAELSRALRAASADSRTTPSLLSSVQARREMVNHTAFSLEASRAACDLLAPELARAAEAGLAAMRHYVDALEAMAVKVQAGDIDEACLAELDALQAAMVEAHQRLAAASTPDAAHLPLSPALAGVPTLWTLHQALQGYLNHRVSAARAQVAVRELATRFAEARVQWMAPPPEAADAVAVAETLRQAYEEGTLALSQLEACLPSCDLEVLFVHWQMLEGAFGRMHEAQAMRVELEDELGVDVLFDE